jgi:hypothetical protein
MKINPQFRILDFTLGLEVIEALDFALEPILLLEKDTIGNLYLSYLSSSDGVNETRLFLQVSKERLELIFDKKLTIHDAFSKPENKYLYITEFSLHSGDVINFYLIPEKNILDVLDIPKSYDFEKQHSLNQIFLDEKQILAVSERKQKLIFDFYLQSKNLVNNIKPYAFFKVFNPLINIIKILLDFDNRNADSYLAFSNLRQNSLGITIEVNYSKDLFLEKEDKALETIIKLLNAKEQADFKNIISTTKNSNYIKEYATIIKAIIDNDAQLNTAYANPILKKVVSCSIDKEKAKEAKKVLDETFDVIEDFETINGTFLEIDIDTKEPSFKIHSESEDFTLKGKFELSLLDKVKNDFINIGKENYTFTIKTIYTPETSVKNEEIKRFMTNYEKN